MSAPRKESGRRQLILAMHARGFIVQGDTFGIKEMLKSEGGKWDPMLQGWVFPFERKVQILDMLRTCPDVSNAEDKALPKIQLEHCREGFLVSGETFHVKELLKNHGGIWQPEIRGCPELKGWVFQKSQQAELVAAMRSLAEVIKVSPASAEVAAAIGERLGSKALVALTPERQSGKASRGAEISSRKEKAPLPTLSLPNSSASTKTLVPAGRKKVTDTSRRARQVTTGQDGSQVETRTDEKRRRISCKRSGETQSVTKKRKVVETKNKVVETATIVVKRVRNK